MSDLALRSQVVVQQQLMAQHNGALMKHLKIYLFLRGVMTSSSRHKYTCTMGVSLRDVLAGLKSSLEVGNVLLIDDASPLKQAISSL
jgi:hypothetical protein